MDFLSFCPLLVDILQEVDYKDIPNCTLVNRRILDVIKMNSLSMPRQCSSLYMSMLKEPSTQSRYVRISVFLQSSFHTIYVTEEYTILPQLSSSIAHYYKENRIQQWFPLSFVGEQIMENIRQHFESNRRWLTSHLIYNNDSLEEGLRTLLSLLFRRYYFKTIEPSASFSEEIVTIIGEEFRRNRSKCSTLYSNYRMPGLRELITKLDCKTTIFFSTPCGYTPPMKMKAVLELATCIKPIRAVFHKQNDNLQDMSNFLQEWGSGLFSLNKVTTATYSNSLYDLLPSVKGIISDTTEHSHTPEEIRRVQIARPHDNKILFLTFSGGRCIELTEK